MTKRILAIVAVSFTLVLAVVLPTSANAQVANFYGSGIGTDTLFNTTIGESGNVASFRFRATHTGALSSLLFYLMHTQSGYASGNNGVIKVDIQTDDGTSSHNPSGTTLASYTLVHPSSYAQSVTFSPPATLQAGTLYHVVFSNVDPNPGSNFSSVNSLYQRSEPSPLQPTISNTDWAHLIKNSSSGWSQRKGFTPILQLNYSDGTVAGIGYRYIYIRNIKSISGSNSAREQITVSGANQQVNKVSVRLARTSGSDPLTVRLEKSDGTVLEQGTIPASAFPQNTLFNYDINVNWASPNWGTYTFSSPQTLVSGQSYNLVLSSPSGTNYEIFPIGKGGSSGFSNKTFFPDGNAQFNNGGGWSSWDAGTADLQFYFETSAGGGSLQNVPPSTPPVNTSNIYYVSPTGSDSNVGTQSAPFKTITKAASVVTAGGTVNIASGNYPEFVKMTTSGTASNRITFIGPASMIGFNINAQYITLDGLTFDANLGTPPQGSLYLPMVDMGNNPSNYNIVKNCVFNGRGQGSYSNPVFRLVAVGFGSDSNRTVGNYNLVQNCTIRGFNFRFINMFGSHNTIDHTKFIGDGASGDVVDFMGYYNTLSNNEVSNIAWSPILHTDIIEAARGDWHDNVVENNYFHDSDVQLGDLEQQIDPATGLPGTQHDYIFRNNVFANITWTIFVGAKRTMFYNNVFYKVGGARSIAFYNTLSGGEVSDGSEMINNVFITGGSEAGARFEQGSANVTMHHNYGGTTSFGPSTGLLGANSISGGDPKFVNISNLDFHLQNTSPLINSGVSVSGINTDKDGITRPQAGGYDIGAYEYSGTVAPQPQPVPPPTPTSYTLSVIKVGTAGKGSGTVTSSGGSINCGTACSTTATPNLTITLTATPSTGSTFIGWSGGGCATADSPSDACTFKITANTTISAQFSLIQAPAPQPAPAPEPLQPPPPTNGVCVNPPSVPGTASPCPVLSLSQTTISRATPLTITLTPGGEKYIYKTIYVSKGSSTCSGTDWCSFDLPSPYVYSDWKQTSSPVSVTIPANTLSVGTHYILSWDWTWTLGNSSCFVGPGSTSCGGGIWRLQKVNVIN